ncbi:MAG: alanine racemase, partial [Oscillospiraceae bacterium]
YKQIVKKLNQCNIDFFAVSNLAEAMEIRKISTSDILILGYTQPDKATVLANNNITQAVFSYEYAKKLDLYAKAENCFVKAHYKIDTGMSRLGFRDIEELYSALSLENIVPAGIFTHLSSADMDDAQSKQFTANQVNIFKDIISKLKERNIEIPLVHLQNSAGISCLDLNYNYVRAGIIMFGYPPSDVPLTFDIMPVMEVKSVVAMVKTIEKGTAVSYARNFIAPNTMKIATVPIGYADGYSRMLSNKSEVLIKGKRAKVLGNICMDQMMIDVSHIDNVAEGDIVTIVGEDGDEFIGFNELADIMGSISYELMCLISRRVPRVYCSKGEIVDIVDYLA